MPADTASEPSSSATFSQISILGVGLLGGSIGLALKARTHGRPTRVIGYAHRPATLHAALARGAVDDATDDAARAVADAELVILCTPVGMFGEMLRRIAPALHAGAIVTDVGSTKRSVVQLAEELLPPPLRPRFVGSHPMAGSEKRGVEHARPELFEGALCILTPTDRTDPSALAAVERVWRQDLVMRTTRTSPDDHDRLLASASHLPHAVAAALVAMQDERALDFAASGFRDATRLAMGDPALWRDIFLDNADHLRTAIQRLRGQLDEFESLLNPADPQALARWLDRAAEVRKSL